MQNAQQIQAEQRLYVLAGEASGDLHAANAVRALRQMLPDLSVRGMGGDQLAAAGTELLLHIRDTNFMGFVEVVRNLATIRKMFARVKADIAAWQPDVLLLVDYPGFNLRMAKWAHQRGIRVVYYISPQLWAWKAGRVEQVRRYVDEMLVILPFEPAFYAQHGVQVTYVGHPLPDALAQLPGPDTGLGEMLSPTGRPIVALLPGSRKAEIRRMLPAMLEVARALPDYQFVVAGAPSQPLAFYTHLIGDAPVAVCSNQTYALLQLARAALVTSGTATLETALLNVPLVVAYQADALSYRIAKWVVGSRIRYISLVNLILDQPVVPECIQQEMHPKRLQAELLPLLETPDQPARLAQTTAFVHLRSLLGNGGASQQVAARLAHHLQPSSQPMA